MTTVYVTKWALTRGILIWNTEDAITGKADDWRGLRIDAQGAMGAQGGYPTRAFLFGDEWHITQEGAVIKARLMRVRKIASLERQQVKLRAMTFEVEE